MSARAFTPVVALFGLALAGCNRGPTVVVVPPAPPPVVAHHGADAPRSLQIAMPELTPRERYDATLWDALVLVADRKLAEAQATLEKARTYQDTEQVRQEIAQIKLRRDVQAAAERTTHDIQTVLADGKADQAARLVFAALNEYGGSEASENLSSLKRQADALVSVQLDQSMRQAHFRQEAEEAARTNNLRAAVLAYEQAAAYGADDVSRRRLDELHTTLARYDDDRRRAAELRHDPARLEEALAVLRDAATVWDTLQVRQEIDDCMLALQSRRERLSVADFETRGEVGVAQFGRTVAEELLPAFKARFDLVERDQLGKVLDELKLRSDDLMDHDAGRGELSRIAGVRYLVVGSITRLGGVSAHARLLDLRTGLVVQTAKVSAPTAEALMPLLPRLAAMLQMSDDQRLAYEKDLASQAIALTVAPELVVVPPPPVIDASGSLPPIVVATPRPPEFGGVVIADFGQLPQVGLSVQLALTTDHKVRARALSVAIDLGDNLFRRGQFREAQAQYQLALNLSLGHADVLVRMDRCQPHLPPAAPVPVVVRPRAVVLDFAAPSDPALGAWAAEQIAPYLCPPYDVADRGEVYWYMGRLGLTLRDAVGDPLARLYLGRALNTRYIVLGTLQTTPAGLSVAAHLLDTETGARLATAEGVARDRSELKYRLGELARWLLLDPAERVRVQAEAVQAEAFVLQAQQAAKQANFTLAIEFAKKAGQKRPGIQVEVLLSQFDRQAQVAALEAQRRAEWERQQALAAEAARRQQALAAAVEAARAVAAQQAAAVADVERRRQREAAYAQMLAQARAARDARNFTLSLQLFDGALGIERRDDVVRESALVRAQSAEQARVRAAEEAAARERALRQQKEAELAQVRAQVDAERQQRAAVELARRKAQEDADARRLAGARAQADVEAKARADADARRLAEARSKADADAKARGDVEAKRLADARAKADADAKERIDAEAKARADADARARADVLAKARADAEAKAKADGDAKARADALAKARTDADAKARVDAEAKTHADAEARLRAAAEAKAKADAEAKARVDAEAKARADAEAHLRAAAEAKTRADAEAKAKADAAARAKAAPPAKAPPPPAVVPIVPPPPPPAAKAPTQPPASPKAVIPPPPPTAYTQQMQLGAALEKQEKFADAHKAYQAALLATPNDPSATQRGEYAKQMDAGITALKANKHDDAARAFEAALKAVPNDAVANRWLQQARRR